MTVQSHESNVLSHSECNIAISFGSFAPRTHWREFTSPSRLPRCTAVFLLATLVKKLAPPRNCYSGDDFL